ncbi:MAG: hypothetical protein IJV04_10570 [Lachnospiraceae bacterium]|nr:hypothetical protein [Lachnospiraceae bacterium]
MVQSNESGDILVCEDLNDSVRTKYTVIVLNDHSLVRRFLQIYHDADYLPKEQEYEYFSSEGKYLISYPYVRLRPLSSFYMGKLMTLEEAEEISRNLVVACMACGVPWPILYLMLKQDQVHLMQDMSIHLSYMIDLTELDEEITENDCVVECARILLSILGARTDKKADSYVLLEKKIGRQSYSRFMELYRDIEIAGVSNRRRGLLRQIRAWLIRNKDNLFRVLLIVSLILLIFTIISLITNAIFGDVPWLRLFIRSFEKIGLESLLQ